MRPILSSMIQAARSITIIMLLLAMASGDGSEWKDYPKTLGWGTFEHGRPFDIRDNLKYCDRKVTELEKPDNMDSWHNKITEELQKLKKSGGGTVKLQSGVYYLAWKVEIPSYTCLVGEGMNKTTLRLVDNAAPFDQAGMVRSKYTAHVSIAHLTIDGNRENQVSQNLTRGGAAYGRFGIFTHLTNYLYIYQVRAVNHSGYGMDPHGSKDDWAYFLILDGCQANYNGLDGFTLDQTLYVLLNNSTATGNGRHGVNIVTGTRYCQVEGNIVRSNGFESDVGCSMMAQNNQKYNTQNINFTNNKLIDGRKSGFCMNDVSNVTIINNTIMSKRNNAFCYYFDNTRSTEIDDTKCTTKGVRVRARESAEYDFL